MKLFNRFYIQIIAVCVLLVIVISGASIYVTQNIQETSFKKKSQQINAGIAEHLVKETPPFIEGQVNDTALHHIMHHMMAVNPSIEVYLLNPQGDILSYVAPHKKIKLDKVSIEPIKTFIESKGETFVEGDDPRNPGVKKIFSATSVTENGQHLGYVYIILLSEEHDEIAQTLWSEYLEDIGSSSIVLVLIFSIIIAVGLIWLITRYLRSIVRSVKSFSSGNLRERIEVKNDSELNSIAIAFNEMADTILQNIEKIKSVESLRKELIVNISHDLRTPIAVSRGYIETALMKSNASEEERKAYLETALASTEKMETLVSNLFELSKLEADGFKPDKDYFLITDLVENVSEKYKLIAEQKGIKLKSNFDGSKPKVYADPALIERVLQNLIDNALKFTPQGGSIVIDVSSQNEDVKIQVQDTGKGINNKEVDLIFDRFHKSKEGGGTGLGLAIVKRILNLHDTTINLQSAISEGSNFSFVLTSRV